MKSHHLLVIFLIFAIASCDNSAPVQEPLAEEIIPLEVKENQKFGFKLDNYNIETGAVGKNDFLSNILSGYDIPYSSIDELVKNSKDTFDVRKIRPGKEFHMLMSKDSLQQAEYFIYEKDAENYVVFCLVDSLYAYCGRKPVELKLREASGTIESSLYQTMQDNDLSPALTMELADMFAWTIDFYRIQPGDYFKVIFEEKYVDGKMIGISDIIAADFNHNQEDYYSFLYTQDSIPDYFDEQGNSLKKAFLKAPLKFSRISSRYNKKRFHPVLKRVKAHLGTDYAAAKGTPIVAVGDGVVINSQYKRNNGNYVKIRHNSTYETQYLHMSKRAAKVGDRVRQGDVIGYVGSTGLATGPHVCFRFWKNGEQVDHLREKFPPSKPIKEEEKTDYQQVSDSLKNRLDAIELEIQEEEI